MYSAYPTKGHYPDPDSDIQVILFTAVRPCSMERCPIFDLCPYTKAPNVKCKVEITYLDALFKSLLNISQGEVSQEMMNKYTLHILPLHQMLIKFKIYAYSIEETFYTTRTGNIVVHPVFKEIRNTIRQIESSLSNMGIDKEYSRFIGLSGRGKGKDPSNYGDPDYWNSWKDELDADILPDGPRKGVKIDR